MFGVQEVVSSSLEFLQLCRNGGRTRGFLLEEILPATLPPRHEDDYGTFRRLHVQKPPRTHRCGDGTFSSVRGDSRPPFLGADLLCLLSGRQGGGLGVSAGRFSPPSTSVEHQRHSLQRLHGWYRPSVEHPNRQCNIPPPHLVFLSLICFFLFLVHFKTENCHGIHTQNNQTSFETITCVILDLTSIRPSTPTSRLLQCANHLVNHSSDIP